MEPPIAISTELRAAYDAVLQASLVVRHNPPGVLRLRGAGTLDFLHRMSTNDMTGMSPGDVRGTVLTTAIGRTVDVVQVLVLPSESLLLTTPGRSAAVREWLSRYIFFNDDVRIDLVETAFAHWGVYGPGAAAEVGHLGVLREPHPPTTGRSVAIEDGWLWGTSEPVPGFAALAGEVLQSRIQEIWREPSAANEAYEVIRIERGVPAVGREIDEDTIPLEVGLWPLVSFSKGCYIGQEVIARMESRSRVARTLTGLRLSRPESVPQEVVLDGQPVGRLTSAAVSPRFGPIGLALVRTSVLDDPALEVSLAPDGGSGKVERLPFDATRA
jgi:aminomethyltransferase